MWKLIVIIIIMVAVVLFWIDRSSKRVMNSDRIFKPYKDKIHEEPEQQIRIERSLNETFDSKILSAYAGEVVGSSGKKYTVSLEYCSCPDFSERKKPCKHMYYFAVKSGRCKVEKQGKRYKVSKL